MYDPSEGRDCFFIPQWHVLDSTTVLEPRPEYRNLVLALPKNNNSELEYHLSLACFVNFVKSHIVVLEINSSFVVGQVVV